MSRTLFVDGRRGSFTPDGTIGKPYPAIQDAVNAAAVLKPAPSAADPVVVAILQGVYKENVFVGHDGLCLRGLGGAGTVSISPDKGPALIVSNATQASVQKYIGGGDPHALQGGGKLNSPHLLHVFDLQLATGDPAASAVYVVGDPKGPPLGDAMISLSHCMINAPQKALHAYFCHYIWVRHNSEVTAATDIFNCGGIWVDDSSMLDFKLTYDSGHDLGVPQIAGFPGGQFGLVGYNSFFPGGTVELRLTAKPSDDQAAGGLQPTIQTTFWDLVVAGHSAFNMIGGYANSVTVEGTANWYGQDVHVQGDMSFAAGPGKVQMDGGRYMGSVSDASGKFVRNPGK